MRRILLAGLLGGIAAFVWGVVWWGVLPFQTAKFADIPDEAAVAEALKQRLAGEGVFHYPARPAATATTEEERAWMRRLEAGPIVPVLVYMPGGASSPARAFVGEVVIDVLAATVAAWLLSLAAVSRRRYLSRVAIVAAMGAFAALVTYGSDWSWSIFPARYALVSAIDLVLEWTVVGLVLAWRLAPDRVRHTVELRARPAVA